MTTTYDPYAEDVIRVCSSHWYASLHNVIESLPQLDGPMDTAIAYLSRQIVSECNVTPERLTEILTNEIDGYSAN